MINVIQKLHEVLNQVKGFDHVGYSSRTVNDGYMMFDYEGKRYAVKMVEVENPNENPFRDLDRVQYYI